MPVPISTPGWDNAPYLSAGHYITKDPETGIQNVGNYRGQIKAPRRLGMNPSVELRAGIYAHWQKCKARGEPLPCAVVRRLPAGRSPTPRCRRCRRISTSSRSRARSPAGRINVVKAQDRRSAGAGRGRDRDRGLDQHRAAGARGAVRRIARLRQPAGIQRLHGGDRDHAAATSDPHLVHQPGDAERVERDPQASAMEPVYLNHLRTVLGIKGVKRVAMHEPLTSLYAVIAIQFERGAPESEDLARALRRRRRCTASPANGSSRSTRTSIRTMPTRLFWAMSYRCQPQHDLQGRPAQGPRPRTARPARRRRERGGADQCHAEGHLCAGRAAEARIHGACHGQIWERLGLPPLKPQPPWHGYDLGHWPEELERQAEMAARSEYFELGKNLANERRSDVAMNTPVQRD